MCANHIHIVPLHHFSFSCHNIATLVLYSQEFWRFLYVLIVLFALSGDVYYALLTVHIKPTDIFPPTFLLIEYWNVYMFREDTLISRKKVLAPFAVAGICPRINRNILLEAYREVLPYQRDMHKRKSHIYHCVSFPLSWM